MVGRRTIFTVTHFPASADQPRGEDRVCSTGVSGDCLSRFRSNGSRAQRSVGATLNDTSNRVSDMGSTDDIVRGWVDFAADAGRAPDPFPSSTLLDRLSSTFETSVGWNWLRPDGRVGWEVLHPPPGWPPPSALDVWLSRSFDHPLLRWFAATRSLSPMTLGRVPGSLADRYTMAYVRDALASVDMVQQLAIPITMSPTCHESFVISRGGRDFTDDEFLTAHRLQPLLMLLDRQARLCAMVDRAFSRRYGLTNREVAVLELLRRGLTSSAISRHLGCAPRTVDKHLEHLYRKLDVRDRLGAIRLADAYGPRDTVTRIGRATNHLVATPDVTARSGHQRTEDRDQPVDLLIFAGRLNKRPNPELLA